VLGYCAIKGSAMKILEVGHELIGDDILEQDIAVTLEFVSMSGKISLEHHRRYSFGAHTAGQKQLACQKPSSTR
jgi:hypothetical protein